MRYLAYGALAFLAAKLLFEDLRHGHMEFIAASIFVFAITLIAVPRLVRMGKGIHGPNLAK
jgi:predicted tellurium resistance membrane protein TerC